MRLTLIRGTARSAHEKRKKMAHVVSHSFTPSARHGRVHFAGKPVRHGHRVPRGRWFAGGRRSGWKVARGRRATPFFGNAISRTQLRSTRPSISARVLAVRGGSMGSCAEGSSHMTARSAATVAEFTTSGPERSVHVVRLPRQWVAEVLHSCCNRAARFWVTRANSEER